MIPNFQVNDKVQLKRTWKSIADKIHKERDQKNTIMSCGPAAELAEFLNSTNLYTIITIDRDNDCKLNTSVIVPSQCLKPA